MEKKKAHRRADVSGDNPDEKEIRFGGVLASDAITSKRRLNRDIKDIREAPSRSQDHTKQPFWRLTTSNEGIKVYGLIAHMSCSDLSSNMFKKRLGHFKEIKGKSISIAMQCSKRKEEIEKFQKNSNIMGIVAVKHTYTMLLHHMFKMDRIRL